MDIIVLLRYLSHEVILTKILPLNSSTSCIEKFCSINFAIIDIFLPFFL